MFNIKKGSGQVAELSVFLFVRKEANMTVLEKEMMEAIISIADSLDDLNKQIRKQNELLEMIAEKGKEGK